MQTLKDLMRNAVTPAPAADLDAETERLSGSNDLDSLSDMDQSSDDIPDDFMGVTDVPPFDGSSSSVSWMVFITLFLMFYIPLMVSLLQFLIV